MVMCETPLLLRPQAGAHVEHGQHAPAQYPADWDQQIRHLHVCNNNYLQSPHKQYLHVHEWVLIMQTAWIIRSDIYVYHPL